MSIETLLRAAPLALALLLLAAEWRWPWRAARRERWLGNAGLGLLSFVAVLVLPLASMTAAAQWATLQGFGLLHALRWPAAVEIALAVLALDLALYAQHRALHGGWLWRLHRVHHLDPHLDVTSGVRFHPLEAVGSALFKSLIVALLGAPALAVAVSATLTLAASLFAHANVRLAAALDDVLARVLVTPGLHRIHHSARREEERSNFGSVLSVWDALAGSLRRVSADGEALTIGSGGSPARTRLVPMLSDPLR